MKITDAIKILNTQYALGRTTKGRPITDIAKNTITAILEDDKNYGNDVVKCLGCGYVTSILLTSSGCPNCGVEDMTTNIE